MTTATSVLDGKLRLLERVGLTLSPEFVAAMALDSREQLITGGVRAGKSTLLAAKVFCFPKVAFPCLIWIVGPTYKATEEEMGYLHQWFSTLGIVARFDSPTNEVWRLELQTGAVIETRSATHPERLASVAPDMIVVTEAGQCRPEVKGAVDGRAIQKFAPVIYGGTIETDDNKPQYAWFEALAVEWLAHPTYSRSAISLPSWANLHEFNGIDENTGKVFVDRDTGEVSGVGREDYRIRHYERNTDPYTFARMYAGNPLGAPHPAYPELRASGVERLQPLPDGTRWLTHVGGGDWGVQHPWTLVVVGVSTQVIQTAEDVRGYKRNVAWVRECVWSGHNNGDSQLFNQTKRKLASKYGVLRWGVDPVQSALADNAGTTTVSGAAGSRDLRIGLVRSRLRMGTLLYDLRGPGVTELVSEQKGVHYRVTSQGKMELVRIDDDRTAALEDSIYVLDKQGMALPRRARATMGGSSRVYVRE